MGSFGAQMRGTLAVLLAGLVGGLIAFVAGQSLIQLSSTMASEKTQIANDISRLASVVELGDGQGADDVKAFAESFRPDFLKGGEDSLVVADLQARLRAVVVGNNSELSSARSLPGKLIGNQNMLGLRLQIRGEMKKVQEILYEIEYGSPFLFVERAELRLEDQRGAIQDNPEVLIPNMFAEIDVYGAKWPDQLDQAAEATGGVPAPERPAP